VESDIPEEHENGYTHNEYLRRYNLNIKTSTWNKDSQGLFDFETSHLHKQTFVASKESVLLRNNRDDCMVEDLTVDADKKYGWHAQKLINVKKKRNSYILESPEVESMAKMTDQQKKEFMAKDVDLMYRADTGARSLPCSQMNEKMYLILRTIANRNEK